MWLIYELLLAIGIILYMPSLFLRKRLPHAGWTMRLGRYPRAVSDALRGKRAIWVHAVSVGEVAAIQPLLRKLRERYPDAPLVLSTVTPAGFEMATKLAGATATVIYAPFDLTFCVSRALRLMQPRALLLVESELWPTLIRLTKRRQAPIAIVNGRISAKALNRYRLVAPLLRGMMRSVDGYFMQTKSDAERAKQLGAPADRVRVFGSLKWDASLGVRPDPRAVLSLAHQLGLAGGAVIVAGSTHRGEEVALIGALKSLRRQGIAAQLILAPRHLERLSEVDGVVAASGLSGGRVAELHSGQPWQVAIVDTMGQLPFYYALATIVFIGGSLIPHGGQNPLEAAVLGKPIVVGPYMHNFAEILQYLLHEQAVRQLGAPDQLAQVLSELLLRPADADEMGRRALATTERNAGAGARTLDALAPLLVQ